MRLKFILMGVCTVGTSRRVGNSEKVGLLGGANMLESTGVADQAAYYDHRLIHPIDPTSKFEPGAAL